VRSDDRDEPFLARDMVYLDGMLKQRVYVIPSRELVIVRLGENARGWDDAALPNTLIRGMIDGTTGDPSPGAGETHRSPLSPSASSHQPRTKVAA
jgi:hypothetical protein